MWILQAATPAYAVCLPCYDSIFLREIQYVKKAIIFLRCSRSALPTETRPGGEAMERKPETWITGDERGSQNRTFS